VKRDKEKKKRGKETLKNHIHALSIAAVMLALIMCLGFAGCSGSPDSQDQAGEQQEQRCQGAVHTGSVVEPWCQQLTT
jgi:hypothetical protein